MMFCTVLKKGLRTAKPRFKLHLYHNEKILNAVDQRDIVWFVSSACYLRRHWPECFGHVKRTFCLTGAIDVLLGAVVCRPISA